MEYSSSKVPKSASYVAVALSVIHGRTSTARFSVRIQIPRTKRECFSWAMHPPFFLLLSARQYVAPVPSRITASFASQKRMGAQESCCAKRGEETKPASKYVSKTPASRGQVARRLEKLPFELSWLCCFCFDDFPLTT